MPTYTTRPTPIDAIRYDAPTDAKSDGNLADVEAFVDGVVVLVKQAPWNPEDGQSCLVMWRDGDEDPSGLLQPGGYLIKADDGSVVALEAAAFEAQFEAADASEDESKSKRARATS